MKTPTLRIYGAVIVLALATAIYAAVIAFDAHRTHQPLILSVGEDPPAAAQDDGGR